MDKIFGLSGKLAVVFSKRRINAMIAIMILLASALSFVAITRSISNAYIDSADFTISNMNYDAILSFSNPVSWEYATQLSNISAIQDYLLVGWLGYLRVSNNASLSVITVDIEKFSKFINFDVIGGSFTRVKNETFGVFDITIINNRYLSKTLGNNPINKKLTIDTELGKTNIICKLYIRGNLPLTWLYVGPASLGQSIFVDKSFAMN